MPAQGTRRKLAHPPKSDTRQARRDAIWASVRSQPGDFTFLDIEKDTGIKLSTINRHIAGLVRAGFVMRVTEGRRMGQFDRAYWRLVKDIGVEAPRVSNEGRPSTAGVAESQMWRTMKMLNNFDARELALHASTEACTVTYKKAQEYARYLHLAGYLVMTRESTTRQSARYRLLTSRISGPRPPVVQRVRQVFDPNLSRVVYEGGGQ